MKKLLTAMFVALLLVGCGEEAQKQSVQQEDSPESNQTSAETPPAKTAQVAKIDLDDNETRNRIIAEAIEDDELEWRGDNEGEKPRYAPDEQNPYSGWTKKMHDNGQIEMLLQYKDGKIDGLQTRWHSNGQKQAEGNTKDGKKDGPETWWYSNGQKKEECTYKDGKLMSLVAWKINGDKCPHTNVVNGNGVVVEYYDDGTEKGRLTLKDGEIEF